MANKSADNKQKNLADLLKRKAPQYGADSSLHEPYDPQPYLPGDDWTNYHAGGFPPHQHIAPRKTLVSDHTHGIGPWVGEPHQSVGPMEGLDELCQLLGVEPTTETTGLLLSGQSGRLYSLVDVISAQLSVMTRLHVLLVHSRLTPETGE